MQSNCRFRAKLNSQANRGTPDPIANASEVAKLLGFVDSRFTRSCPRELDKSQSYQ